MRNKIFRGLHYFWIGINYQTKKLPSETAVFLRMLIKINLFWFIFAFYLKML
jgi:hypothetical protein